jgi:hypothetical protein
MDTKKITQAIRAAGNFASADVKDAPEPFVSEADVRGLKEPAMSDAQRGGLGVQMAQAAAYITSLEGQATFMQERAAAEKARDDAIWARVQSRATAL